MRYVTPIYNYEFGIVTLSVPGKHKVRLSRYNAFLYIVVQSNQINFVIGHSRPIGPDEPFNVIMKIYDEGVKVIDEQVYYGPEGMVFEYMSFVQLITLFRKRSNITIEIVRRDPTTNVKNSYKFKFSSFHFNEYYSLL